MSSGDSSLKGGYPQRNSNKQTPKDHQSASPPTRRMDQKKKRKKKKKRKVNHVQFLAIILVQGNLGFQELLCLRPSF